MGIVRGCELYCRAGRAILLHTAFNALDTIVEIISCELFRLFVGDESVAW